MLVTTTPWMWSFNNVLPADSNKMRKPWLNQVTNEKLSPPVMGNSYTFNPCHVLSYLFYGKTSNHNSTAHASSPQRPTPRLKSDKILDHDAAPYSLNRSHLAIQMILAAARALLNVPPRTDNMIFDNESIANCRQQSQQLDDDLDVPVSSAT
jgi:hypothetical protein